MSVRLRTLETIIYQIAKHTFHPIPQLRYEMLSDSSKEMLHELVKKWGGNPSRLIKFQPRPWQIELEGNIAVCLDENISFNRYRLETLYYPFYQTFKGFSLSNYQRYCRQFETECAKTATNTPTIWSTQQGEYFFGPSSPVGEWNGNGSNGLKMLAFTHFWEDLTTTCLPVKVIRISIWDNIMIQKQLFSLDKMLLSPTPSQREALSKMLKRKLESIT
ncbi:MAG: hypothetical protein NZM38_06890 [Cytophagales bacterium]|nr:hypothetical protein [Cytophagales bacterium]MDW8384483.1 hypothetical protein [Flammeovirgaceae bacterium]